MGLKGTVERQLQYLREGNNSIEVSDIEVISIKKSLEYKDRAIKYFQSKWASPNSMKVYEDCITNCINTTSPLPQWYLLLDNDKIIGCAGLITNDFISRMDLYPWVCAIYIEEDYRGNNYGSLLIEQAKADAKKVVFLRYISVQIISDIMKNLDLSMLV